MASNPAAEGETERVPTELEILVDKVKAFRQWHTDLLARPINRKSEGDKLMKKCMTSFVVPEPRPLPDEENYNLTELKRELTEWDRQCRELAARFKAPGNVAITDWELVHKSHKKKTLKCDFPQLIFTPPGEVASDFYIHTGDRVRFKKGSKGKVGAVSDLKEDHYMEVKVQWDDGEIESGLWCGKKDTFQLVYAMEK